MQRVRGSEREASMLRAISLQRASSRLVVLASDAWTILSGIKAKVSEPFLSTLQDG